MIKDDVFKEFANEIKGLHNSAFTYIEQKDYDKALSLYQRALELTQIIKYREGIAMSLFNLANLHLILDDAYQAMAYASQAKNHLEQDGLDAVHCDDLLMVLSCKMKEIGIAHERQGEFKEAILCYKTALPYADDESKSTMEHEIELLRGYVDD